MLNPVQFSAVNPASISTTSNTIHSPKTLQNQVDTVRFSGDDDKPKEGTGKTMAKTAGLYAGGLFLIDAVVPGGGLVAAGVGGALIGGKKALVPTAKKLWEKIW